MVAGTITSSLKDFLSAHAPFSRMADEDLEFVVRNVEMAYYAPGETLLAAGADVRHCWIVRQGTVRAVRAHAGGDAPDAAELGPGACFPAGALLAGRSTRADYIALADTFCLLLPRARFDELVRRSDVFFDYCKRRLASLLDLSQRELRASYAARADAESTMGAPLAGLLRGPAIACDPDTPLRTVFETMQAARVGSMVVSSGSAEGDAVLGIVTRSDLIERVILPARPLSAPVRDVMTSPVQTIPADASAADAVLLMAEFSIRHVPVVSAGSAPHRLLGVVSERDLFALQRLSVARIATAIGNAATVPALGALAADVRRLSRHLVAQGLGSGALTRLISRFNDQLTRRLLALAAERHAVDPAVFCWLAFGSEGREEQTIATDQDNGIVYDEARADRDVLLAMARWMNEALAALGFPLCKGNVMAGNPALCLTESQWRAKYATWIDRGDPESLLSASIFFDVRPLFGRASLATGMHADVVSMAARNQRFVKQMADNALRNRAPAEPGILESLLGDSADAPVDLKMHGTVPLVDAARIWALGAGIAETNTTRRLQRLVDMQRLPREDAEGWIGAFEFLQLVRLRVQHQADGASGAGNPNLVDPRQLSSLDRRILKEAFRQARRAQHRLQLDYPG